MAFAVAFKLDGYRFEDGHGGFSLFARIPYDPSHSCRATTRLERQQNGLDKGAFLATFSTSL